MSKVDLDNIDLGGLGTSGCYSIPAWGIESMIAELLALRKLADALKKAREEHYCNVPDRKSVV